MVPTLVAGGSAERLSSSSSSSGGGSGSSYGTAGGSGYRNQERDGDGEDMAAPFDES
eukprot:evm.model.NODE_12390_length_20121_cov_16.951593.9